MKRRLPKMNLGERLDRLGDYLSSSILAIGVDYQIRCENNLKIIGRSLDRLTSKFPDPSDWAEGKTIESMYSQRVRAAGKQDMADLVGIQAQLLDKVPDLKRKIAIHGGLTLSKAFTTGSVTYAGVGIVHRMATALTPDSALDLAARMITNASINLGLDDTFLGDPKFDAAFAAFTLVGASSLINAYANPSIHANRQDRLDWLQQMQEALNNSWIKFTSSWLGIAQKTLFFPYEPLTEQSQSLLARNGSDAVMQLPVDQQQTFDAITHHLTKNFGIKERIATAAAVQLLGVERIDANELYSILKSRQIPEPWIIAYDFDRDRCITPPMPTPGHEPAEPCQPAGPGPEL